MGAWIAEFLASQGFEVQIADPAESELPFSRIADWRDSQLEQEIIVVAAPIKATAEILRELADRRPPGLILDVGSLKTPLKPGLQALAAAGCRVLAGELPARCSLVHPVGPGSSHRFRPAGRSASCGAGAGATIWPTGRGRAPALVRAAACHKPP